MPASSALHICVRPNAATAPRAMRIGRSNTWRSSRTISFGSSSALPASAPRPSRSLRQQAAHRKHPEETLRSAQGILRLAQDFTHAALERACEHAVTLKSFSYRAVRTLIEMPAQAPTQPALDLAHENVRGPEYFQ